MADPRPQNSAEERWLERERKIVHLNQIAELLGWDQETQLPPAAVEDRGEQLALIQGLLHDLWADAEAVDLLASLQPNGDPVHDARLREWRRLQRRETCLDQELVQARARATVRAKAAWAQARQKKDFTLFVGHLEEIVRLSREVAARIGFPDHPYTALLEEYEPGITTTELRELFDPLEEGLRELLHRWGESPTPPTFPCPNNQQKSLVRELLQEMGFDFQRGRLDETAHPFCCTLGFDDVRLTNRYREDDLVPAVFGALHEMGHGLYEQGFEAALKSTILAGGASLGIHESQSRFWENVVGRSPAWCAWAWPLLTRHCPALAALRPWDFARAVNRIGPSLIRVEADELTYNLHIAVRFRLEVSLLDGSLSPKDVPEAWNAAYGELLGVVPSDDAQGCLQDIHWSMGALGYFPTYTLGNLYAAMIRQAMNQELNLMETIRVGRFSVILEWLREKIHRHGRIFLPGELMRRLGYQRLTAQPFLEYLEEKLLILSGSDD